MVSSAVLALHCSTRAMGAPCQALLRPSPQSHPAVSQHGTRSHTSPLCWARGEHSAVGRGKVSACGPWKGATWELLALAPKENVELLFILPMKEGAVWLQVLSLQRSFLSGLPVSFHPACERLVLLPSSRKTSLIYSKSYGQSVIFCM